MEIGPGDKPHRTGKSPAEGFHPTNPCPEQGIQTPPPLLAGPSSGPGAADSQRDRDPAGQISEDTDTRVDMSSSSLSLCYLNPAAQPFRTPHLPAPPPPPSLRGSREQGGGEKFQPPPWALGWDRLQLASPTTEETQPQPKDSSGLFHSPFLGAKVQLKNQFFLSTN